jgi:hypothetical protein
MKHVIDSDKKLNPELANDVATLRGLIKVGKSTRFKAERCSDRPAVTITDIETGASTVVGLYAASATIDALNELFGATT